MQAEVRILRIIMARIEIKMVDVFVFETELTIRTTDLNFANHVGNDNFVSLMQEARTRFFISNSECRTCTVVADDVIFN